ncbi:MAG: RluA family pseudouridine synthase [Anaerolineae bacterium]|nr:RluA family pseudouridine synthase [Anaerolineae bacterium]
MTENLEFTVQNPGERLDKLIVTQVGDRLSRAQIQTLIKDGMVTVNGAQVKAGIKLKGGETITVMIPVREAPENVKPEAIPLTVLYEDKDIAVIDKPAGMTVHPGVNNETGTLVAALLSRWPEIAKMNIEEKRAGIVHRLDKDTSGLIIIAKRDVARRKLMAQFQNRTIEKSYLALLEKMPPTQVGRIDAPIARDPKLRQRMTTAHNGRPSVTEYEVIERDFVGGQAMVRINILTGRTHQIRVHMAFIGCPIVGDAVYGYRKQRLSLKRHFLHAAHLCFDHPRTGERMCFDSPLPPGLLNILEKLREK